MLFSFGQIAGRSGIRVPPAYAQPLLRVGLFKTTTQIVLNILKNYQSCRGRLVEFGVCGAILLLDVTLARII